MLALEHPAVFVAEGASMVHAEGRRFSSPMTSKINRVWHKANRMPQRATLDQRVRWHLAHREACQCRTDLPAGILAELKRRGVKVPSVA